MEAELKEEREFLLARRAAGRQNSNLQFASAARSLIAGPRAPPINSPRGKPAVEAGIISTARSSPPLGDARPPPPKPAEAGVIEDPNFGGDVLLAPEDVELSLPKLAPTPATLRAKVSAWCVAAASGSSAGAASRYCTPHSAAPSSSPPLSSSSSAATSAAVASPRAWRSTALTRRRSCSS